MRVARVLLAGVLALVVGCEGRGPTALDDGGARVQGFEPLAGLLEAACEADLGAGTLTCAAPGGGFDQNGPSRVILGSQGTDIVLTASGAILDGSTFSVDVTVQNLIGQAIGTVDGEEVAAEGIRVFFSQEPWLVTGTGTVTVVSHDGTATLLNEPGVKYHQYDELLETGEVSAARTWDFALTGTPDVFRFRVMVSAPVEHPEGWTEVTPDAPVMEVEEELQLSAEARDVLGTPVERSFTWVSLDEEVATVDPDGLVTALSPGTVEITAESSGDESTGSVMLTVLVPGAQYSWSAADFDVGTPLTEAGWTRRTNEAGWVVRQVGGVKVARLEEIAFNRSSEHLTLDVVDEDPRRDDVELLLGGATFSRLSGSHDVFLDVKGRYRGIGDQREFYAVGHALAAELGVQADVMVVRPPGGPPVGLGPTIPSTWTVGEKGFFLLQISGSTLRGKVWKGGVEDEPVDWMFEVVDDSEFAIDGFGSVGVHYLGIPADRPTFEYMTVGTGGLPAPRLPE